MNSVPIVAIWLKRPQRLQLRRQLLQQANGTQCLRTAYQRTSDARLDLLENSCNSLWGKAQSEAFSLLHINSTEPEWVWLTSRGFLSRSNIHSSAFDPPGNC